MKSLIFIIAKLTAAFLIYLIVRSLSLSLFPVSGMRAVGREEPLLYIFAAVIFYFLFELSYLLARLTIKEHSIGQALLNGIITAIIVYLGSVWTPYSSDFSVTTEKVIMILPFFITAFIYPFLVDGVRKLLAKSS